jgi:hypothetical protein
MAPDPYSRLRKGKEKSMDDRAFRWLAPTVALACVLLTHAFGYEEEKGPRVDALFEAARNGPGAAVLVARDGDILTGSGLEREGMSGEGFAVGYRNSNDGVVGAPSGSVEGAYAAGGLYSTVEDLFLLNRALDAGDPIPEDSLRRAFTPARLSGGREVAYGFGWMISRHRGLLEIAHGGDITGFNAYIARYPDQRFAVFVLSNQEMRPPGPLPTAGDLAHRIAEIYLEEEMEAPQSALSVSVPETLLQRYVGVYELEAPVPVVNVMGSRFTVTMEKGRLFGEGKTGKTELLAFSDTEFYVEGSPARLFFIADSEGRATELIFSFLGIREFRAVRVP